LYIEFVPRVSEDHVRARRAQILQGARRCFARWGYEGATVPRLERAIGLSHGAIFNYYRSKLDLFFALAHADHARYEEIWSAEGFGALARAIAAEDPAWLSVYLELHRLLRTNASVAKRWRRRGSPEPDEEHASWLSRLRADGRLRDDVSDQTAFFFLHTLLDGLIMARTTGATFDVEPLVALAEGALAPSTPV
jgi:TetR/AcrR family transcriptional regulator, transcriptional repressor of aconitase